MVQQAAAAKIKAEEIKEEEEALEEMVVVVVVVVAGEVGEVDEVDEAVEEAGVEAPLVEVVERRQLVLPILPQQSLNQLRFSVCVRILLC